jgi:hypothetical protein
MIGVTVKTRVKMNTRHVRNRYKAGNNKALDAAGSMVRQSAKKQFSHRTVKKKPQWQKVGDKDGRPVLSMEFRPPMAGKVTSWKNPRGRGATTTGFLRTMVEYRRDDRKESVVIGPMDKATWLNKLQEFGGSAPRVLKLIGRYPGKSKLLQRFKPPDAMLGSGSGARRDAKTGRFLTAAQRGGKAYVGIWVDPAHTRRKIHKVVLRDTGKIKPGRFMAKGLDAKRAKLAEKWRGKITGP